MGKHLKLNIKNTQLAAALKPKKELSAATGAPRKKTKTKDAPAAEPKKKLTRLRKYDEAAPTTTPEAEIEKPKKRRTRIIQSPDELVKKEKASVEEAPPEAEKKEVKPKEKAEEKPAAQKKGHAGVEKQLKRPPPKELRPQKKKESRFDSRDRQGLRDIDNEAWRKRRAFKPRKSISEAPVVRPKKPPNTPLSLIHISEPTRPY